DVLSGHIALELGGLAENQSDARHIADHITVEVNLAFRRNIPGDLEILADRRTGKLTRHLGVSRVSEGVWHLVPPPMPHTPLLLTRLFGSKGWPKILGLLLRPVKARSADASRARWRSSGGAAGWECICGRRPRRLSRPRGAMSAARDRV